MDNPQNLITAAHTMADIAAKISRKYFRTAFQIDNKVGNFPVTIADREIELALRDWLKENYPEHGIIGEEFDNKVINYKYTWVIDPIDGTVAFSTGKPTFVTLIALLEDGIPLFGVIDQPISQERFCGGKWLRANLNQQIITSSKQNELAQARLNVTTPDMFVNILEREVFENLKAHVRIKSYGGDGYSYGLLASGYIDVILESQLEFYDVAAVIPILQSAGAVITDWQGQNIRQNFSGKCLAAANSQLHTQALKIIQTTYNI